MINYGNDEANAGPSNENTRNTDFNDLAYETATAMLRIIATQAVIGNDYVSRNMRELILTNSDIQSRMIRFIKKTIVAFHKRFMNNYLHVKTKEKAELLDELDERSRAQEEALDNIEELMEIKPQIPEEAQLKQQLLALSWERVHVEGCARKHALDHIEALNIKEQLVTEQMIYMQKQYQELEES